MKEISPGFIENSPTEGIGRVRRFLETVLKEEGNVALVGHLGFFRAMIKIFDEKMEFGRGEVNLQNCEFFEYQT